MKKFLILILLLSTPAFAQRRLAKTACNNINVAAGCEVVDTQEVLKLKTLFNILVADLIVQLGLQTSFDSITAARRFADFNNKILALQNAKDVVKNINNKDALQSIIDEVTSERDTLDSTAPGSQRDKANRAPDEITKLNLQMDDIEASITALTP